MKLESLDDLLLMQVKELYSAEGQLVKLLPGLMNKASSPALKSLIESHTLETERHVDRLKTIGEMLGGKLGGRKSKAMEGILSEIREIASIETADCLFDVAIIVSVQRVESYEVSAYASARSVALQLGYDDVVRLLQETLEEESAVDERLAAILSDEILPVCHDDDDEDEYRSPRESEDEAYSQ